MAEYQVIERLTVSCYWAITTLSVVGYGDYYPINMIEMVIGTLVLLGGVGFFSFVMSSIVDIIENYSEQLSNGPSKEHLNSWITSLERYSGS